MKKLSIIMLCYLFCSAGNSKAQSLVENKANEFLTVQIMPEEIITIDPIASTLWFIIPFEMQKRGNFVRIYCQTHRNYVFHRRLKENSKNIINVNMSRHRGCRYIVQIGNRKNNVQSVIIGNEIQNITTEGKIQRLTVTKNMVTNLNVQNNELASNKVVTTNEVSKIQTPNRQQGEWIVGGQLGFNSDTDKFKPDTGSVKKISTTSTLTIAPMVGYQVSEKFAIGTRINFLSRKDTEFGSNDEVSILTTLGFDIFGQFTFLEIGNFFVYADASFGFGSLKEKVTVGSITNESNPTTYFGLNVRPVLAYSVSKKITLWANLNFLGLGLNSVSEKNLHTKDKLTTTLFGLNFNNNEIFKFGTGTPFQIGCIYRF